MPTTENKPLDLMTDGRKPVFLIAHRINNPKYIEIALKSGVNSIECDMQYNKNSKKFIIGHDYLKKYTFDQWVDGLVLACKKHESKLSLIVFDCKFVCKYNEYESSIIFDLLLDEVRDKILNNNSEVKVLFSIADYKNRNTFSIIKDKLNKNEGLSIDAHKNSFEVQKFFENNNICNCWYGYGAFSFAPINVLKYIRKGITLKNQSSIFKGVYVWTLSSTKKASNYLENIGVDGLIVNIKGTSNFPSCDTHKLIKSIEGSVSIRLASLDDNIF